MTGERFGILIVCHANLCRSPMAERLTRTALADGLGAEAGGFEVVSAGTHAWAGRAMHPLAAEVLRELGIADTGFLSRRLTEGLVNRADLVLTATRRQRSACVTLDTSAVHRTFTIPQIGRYAAAMAPYAPIPARGPQHRLRAMIEQAPVVRGALPIVSPEADDLPDPVQSPIEGFRRCAAEIRSVLDVMIGLIAPIRTVREQLHRTGSAPHRR
jgi:protein-tyrosine phosphatase